jgi:inner membrane protein
LPTIITHSVFAVAGGDAFSIIDVPRRFWLLSVVCSVFPDADVIGFAFGIPYDHFFGHRGFFHSPFFGLLLGIFFVTVFFRNEKRFSKRWWLYILYFFLLSSSHGILDACTDGGLGIALLSPFDNTRYFFPWRPIMVSPIGIKAFLSKWGLMVIYREIVLIWLPLMTIVIISRLIRKTTWAVKIRTNLTS